MVAAAGSAWRPRQPREGRAASDRRRDGAAAAAPRARARSSRVAFTDLHRVTAWSSARGLGREFVAGEVRPRRRPPARRTASAARRHRCSSGGGAPADALAREAGLEVADGIVVGADLRTADPAVVAAGDVAAAYHPSCAVGCGSSTGRPRSAGPRGRGGTDRRAGVYERLPTSSPISTTSRSSTWARRGTRQARAGRSRVVPDRALPGLLAGRRPGRGRHERRCPRCRARDRGPRQGAGPLDPARLADPAVPLEDVVAGTASVGPGRRRTACLTRGCPDRAAFRCRRARRNPASCETRVQRDRTPDASVRRQVRLPLRTARTGFRAKSRGDHVRRPRRRPRSPLALALAPGGRPCTAGRRAALRPLVPSAQLDT